MKVIDTVDGDGCEEEVEIIALARADGINLTNATDGGEGVLGYVPSVETILKLSEATRKQFSTPETRVKHSEATKRGVASPEVRARISEVAKARVFSSGTRAKLSEAMRRRFASPEARAKIADQLRGRIVSQETRAKMSASQKKTHCRRGHELNDANVYLSKSRNERQCKICMVDVKREYERECRRQSKELSDRVKIRVNLL